MAETSLHQLILTSAIEKLHDHFAQIRRCVVLLSDEQLWFRPNASSNSVANLLLHLPGNMGQWIMTGLGGAPLNRHRQAEFDARGAVSREQLLLGLQSMVEEVSDLVRRLPDGALAKDYAIQGYKVSGAAALMHVVEHFAFHTGQIVTTTKWLRDVDLSLYDEQGHRRDGRASGTP
jgi:uncharacterized damage-inducible protein DinB